MVKRIEQVYSCKVPGQLFGMWELQGYLRIYQPHPEQQTVIISDMGWASRWFIPYQVEYLIHSIVEEFQLHPASLVWIEHYSSEFRKPSPSTFNQVLFKWQANQATQLEWVSITAKTAQILAGEPLDFVTSVCSAHPIG